MLGWAFGSWPSKSRRHPLAFRISHTAAGTITPPHCSRVARFLPGPAAPAYGTALETPRSFWRNFALSPSGHSQSAQPTIPAAARTRSTAPVHRRTCARAHPYMALEIAPPSASAF
jgi:hypothetical protein